MSINKLVCSNNTLALSIATFYLKTQPETYSRLAKELQAVTPDPKSLPSWAALERLPYLISSLQHPSLPMANNTHSAVILESIRLSYGVATRLARISPDKDLFYEGTLAGKAYNYTIPKGSPIGMSSVIMHANEDIFPQAAEFIPERWLKEDGSRRHELERYIMSFSKGSRQCLGMK